MKKAHSALPESSNAQRSVARTASSRYGYGWLLPLAIVFCLLLLNACTSNTEKAAESKPAPKTTDLLTARSAFQKVYIAARGWNADAQPYRLESSVTSDANGHDGKAAIWRGSFASPSRRSEKTFTWSGSIADGAPDKGVNPGIEDSYSATNTSTHVFDANFLKIDSDQAYDVAHKHGGEKILAKDPNTPVLYVCDWNNSGNELVWHVIYGASRDDAKLTVSVNASTGEFMRVEK
jgi:hypothetical protein